MKYRKVKQETDQYGLKSTNIYQNEQKSAKIGENRQTNQQTIKNQSKMNKIVSS